MKPPRALSLTVCLGFMLVFVLGLGELGLGPWIAPSKAMAASTTSAIVGDWEGTLDPGAQPKKRVVVHITVGQDGILSGTIDYPDQDTSGILITAITYKQGVLHLESTSALVSYDGTMDQDKSQMSGTWTQGGTKMSLVLKRT
jgi:hypothetical protein